MFAIHPDLPAFGQTSCGDQHMDVRVKQHGAGPGVKNGQNAGTGAEECRIAGQRSKSVRSEFHQQPVDLFGVEWDRARGRNCEGSVKVTRK